jgi:DNA-binding CsgD family transcriptional regulator
MVSLEAFSELLQALYSAPLEQERWQRFLTLVSEYTTSRSGFFLSADTRSGLAVLAEGGEPQDPAVVAAYNEKYARSDPFRAPLVHYSRTRNPVRVFTDEELLPNQGLLSTDFYRNLVSPLNLRYCTVTVLALSVRRLDAISVWRSPQDGPMDPDSRRLLTLLIPHIQTALEVRRALGVTEQRLASAEAMANASRTATFVVTRQGGVRHSNSSAESLIRSGDSFTVINGRLTARDAKANDALAKLLLEVASPAFSLSGPQTSRCLSVGRTAGKRPHQLIAMPLPQTHRNRSDADLLVLVTDPEKTVHFPDETLRALYDLTPAETEVANGLLMGYSLQEIASLRRVSTGTIRQQVKSMLSKTGTKRQSDMVRLFTMVPQAPVPAM